MRTAMKLGFVYEDGAGGVTCALCDVDDGHDLDGDAGFRAAVSEGCGQLAWNRTEWDFRFPAERLQCGAVIVKCRPRGGAPALEAFAGE